jgi:hypothetical protein
MPFLMLANEIMATPTRFPHFVGKHAEPFGSFAGDRSLLLHCESGHGARDGVVETQVERLKLLGRDRHARFDSEPGDHLEEVAIVVNDLRNGRPPVKERVAVFAGASLNLRMVEAMCTDARRKDSPS